MKANKKIAYLTFDGILEPLGQSQILSYLYLMSDKFEFTIFSLEKREDLSKIDQLEKLKTKLLEHNIKWFYFRYEDGVLKNLFNFLKLSFLIFFNNPFQFDIFHCRSFMPTLVAYSQSFIFNRPYLYDMRGYWVEEKNELGAFGNFCFLYKILKYIDSFLLRRAAHIFTLSTVSTNYLLEKMGSNLSISTIYTATDLNKFYIRQKSDNDYITLGYVGTTVGWYNFEETIRFVSYAFSRSSMFRFVIISRDKFLNSKMESLGLDLNRVQIMESNFSKIEFKMDVIDYAVFFINNTFSKSASMPTKFGEFLAKGIPCITNDGIGDVGNIIESNPIIGHLVKDYSDSNYKKIVDDILKIRSYDNIIKSCRNISNDIFSINICTMEYIKVYESI